MHTSQQGIVIVSCVLLLIQHRLLTKNCIKNTENTENASQSTTTPSDFEFTNDFNEEDTETTKK